ncbi:MAG: tetraacyldisaccharide 4'-kinase [Bacteroidia bacterium]|nr:tetraacyldisaccharide 4'-kinase [Bacteroidia bacterium]
MPYKKISYKKILYYLFYPILYIIHLFFNSILHIRHWLYDKGIFKSYQFSNVYTICIGNLNLGGVGKSPHTNYLIQLLKPHYKIAVLSRGYGRISKGFLVVDPHHHFSQTGDEPLMYKLKHPDVVVAVCEDRVKGIQEILKLYPDTQIILLDDAFQHRRLKAHLNILITEFHHPFYEDQLFPLGTLRDIKSSCQRSHIIVFSKTPENTDQSEIQIRENNIHKVCPNKPIFFSEIEYLALYHIHQPSQKINIFQQLYQYNCILVTGIAHPEPLAIIIKEYAQHFYHLKYPDHHRFLKKDFDLIKDIWKEWQKKYPPSIIITTEKDAVRLKSFATEHFNIPIFVAPIEISFQTFSNTFDNKIINYVRTNSTNCSIHSK